MTAMFQSTPGGDPPGDDVVERGMSAVARFNPHPVVTHRVTPLTLAEAKAYLVSIHTRR